MCIWLFPSFLLRFSFSLVPMHVAFPSFLLLSSFSLVPMHVAFPSFLLLSSFSLVPMHVAFPLVPLLLPFPSFRLRFGFGQFLIHCPDECRQEIGIVEGVGDAVEGFMCRFAVDGIALARLTELYWRRTMH